MTDKTNLRSYAEAFHCGSVAMKLDSPAAEAEARDYEKAGWRTLKAGAFTAVGKDSKPQPALYVSSVSPEGYRAAGWLDRLA